MSLRSFRFYSIPFRLNSLAGIGKISHRCSQSKRGLHGEAGDPILDLKGIFMNVLLCSRQIIIGLALLATLVATATRATSVVAQQPQVVAVHLVESHWGGLLISHCDLRSYVFAAREGQRFGSGNAGDFSLAAKPFVLRRIISADSIEIGYDSSLTYDGNSNGPMHDKEHDVVITHEYSRLRTRSVDAGIEYFLRIDSVYASKTQVPAGLDSNGRETTDSERPDTSFFLHKEKIDTLTGDRTVWTERLDSAHSQFVTHGVLGGSYSGGNKKEETGFVLGRQHGLHQRWYDNGQFEVEGSFSGGKQQGTFRFWNRDGSLAGEAQFDSGNGSFALKYEDGQPRLTGQFCGGIPCGLWRQWHPNGQIAREVVVGKGGSRLWPVVPPNQMNWFEIPKSPPPAWDQQAVSAAGPKAWYENCRIKAAAVYDSTVTDTPLDLRALLLPYDSEAVYELSDSGSVTGGKLRFPLIEPHDSRCRVEREWHPNGQISRETFCHDDLSVRKLAWDTSGTLTQVSDWRPKLLRRVDINWGPDGRIESWRISDDESPSPFTAYEIRYRGGARNYSELSHNRNGNRVGVRFDGKGRPIRKQTWRYGTMVSEETINPDSLSQGPK